jgi:hypothetical protein
VFENNSQKKRGCLKKLKVISARVFIQNGFSNKQSNDYPKKIEDANARSS